MPNKFIYSLKDHLKFFISGILLAMLICFVIMLVGRLIFINSFTYDAIAKTFDTQIFANFVEKSVLFDIKYAGMALLPAFIVAIIATPIAMLRHIYRKLFPWLNLAGFLYVLLFTVINYYYYLTYSRIIDVFFFAFMQEDPIATTKTLYEDYPLLQGLLAIIVATIAYLWIFKKIHLKFEKKIKVPDGKLTTSLLLVLLIALDAMAIRGSFGTFPLRQNSAQVSNDPLVNLSVPNGPAAFHWARGWAKEQAIIPEVSIADIKNDYEDLGMKVTGDDIYSPLLYTTKKNEFLEKNPPDIVVSVQESMSTHMSLYDDKEKRDLFGELRRHTKDSNSKEDFFFTNFLSEGNGTMDSLMRMLLEVPDINLSTSTQGEIDYITNSLKVFKEKGYRIVFVTGCQGSWRDMLTYFHRIGMDEIYEENILRQWYKDATGFAWGVDDEYMWRGVLKVLHEKHDQPLLVFTLSISNHPPFRVAENVEPKTIPLTDEELKRFPYPNTTTLFATYRYGNDQLGRFISKVKDDPALSQNTVIAVTGDHNMRGIGYDAHPDELALGHAVPFYMYIPQKYQDHDEISYDKKAWGSQKDFFATIASHTLSEGTMHTLGCDLLGDRSKCKLPYAFNANAAVPWNSNYVCNISEGFAFDALELKGTDDLRAYENKELSLKEAPLCKKAQAMASLERHLYYYQAHNGPKLAK